ncbi:hypothetical protein HDV05_003617, partial [Chytridiales sp. JEL 0842]
NATYDIPTECNWLFKSFVDSIAVARPPALKTIQSSAPVVAPAAEPQPLTPRDVLFNESLKRTHVLTNGSWERVTDCIVSISVSHIPERKASISISVRETGSCIAAIDVSEQTEMELSQERGVIFMAMTVATGICTKYLLRFDGPSTRDTFLRKIDECVASACQQLYIKIQQSLIHTPAIHIPIPIKSTSTLVTERAVCRVDVANTEDRSLTTSHLGPVDLLVTRRKTSQGVLEHISISSATTDGMGVQWLTSPLNETFHLIEKGEKELELMFTVEGRLVRYNLTLKTAEAAEKMKDILGSGYGPDPIFVLMQVEEEEEEVQAVRASKMAKMWGKIVGSSKSKKSAKSVKSTESAEDGASGTRWKGLKGWVKEKVSFFNEIIKNGGL